MSSRARIFVSLLPLFALACGGSAPPPSSPTPANSATSAPPADSSTPPTSAAAPSIVRFDDLGVSFAVPAGLRVVGDDELASRIRSTANPRVTAGLQERSAQGKGLPLLTLVSEKEAVADRVGLTLVAAVVPDDATAAELMDQQLTVFRGNLTDFKVLDGPTGKSRDGVTGSELAGSYAVGGPGSPKTRSRMQVFVRKGRAFIVTAVCADPTAPETELQASALLEGLHFYAPTP